MTASTFLPQQLPPKPVSPTLIPMLPGEYMDQQDEQEPNDNDPPPPPPQGVLVLTVPAQPPAHPQYLEQRQRLHHQQQLQQHEFQPHFPAHSQQRRHSLPPDYQGHYQYQIQYQYPPSQPHPQQLPPGGYVAFHGLPPGAVLSPGAGFPPCAPFARRYEPIVPHENDVLMGRGGKNNLHSGNEKLRRMARKLKDEYIRATKKEKSAMSRQLVKDIQNLDPPGRFLKKSSVSSAWALQDDEYAREKASQCLRDAVNEDGHLLKDDDEAGDDDGANAGDDSEPPVRMRTTEPDAEEQKESPPVSPENTPQTKRKSFDKGDKSARKRRQGIMAGYNRNPAPEPARPPSLPSSGPTNDPERGDIKAPAPAASSQPPRGPSITGYNRAPIQAPSSEPSDGAEQRAIWEALFRTRDTGTAVPTMMPPGSQTQMRRRGDVVHGFNRPPLSSDPTSLVNQKILYQPKPLSGEGLDSSGHTAHSFGSAFELFERDLFQDKDGHLDDLLLDSDPFMADDVLMAKNDLRGSQEEEEEEDMAVDDQDNADYAPMAADDDGAGLSMVSEQMEEQLAMMTDPFETDFF